MAHPGHHRHHDYTAGGRLLAACTRLHAAQREACLLEKMLFEKVICNFVIFTNYFSFTTDLCENVGLNDNNILKQGSIPAIQNLLS